MKYQNMDFVFDLHYLPSGNYESDEFTKIGTLRIPCKAYNPNPDPESSVNETNNR